MLSGRGLAPVASGRGPRAIATLGLRSNREHPSLQASLSIISSTRAQRHFLASNHPLTGSDRVREIVPRKIADFALLKTPRPMRNYR
jgi:hypothetical protein